MTKSRIQAMVSVFLFIFYFSFVGFYLYLQLSINEEMYDDYKWEINTQINRIEEMCDNYSVSQELLKDDIEELFEHYSNIGHRVFKRYSVYNIKNNELIGTNCFTVEIDGKSYLDFYADPDRTKCRDEILNNFNSKYDVSITGAEFYIKNGERFFTSLTLEDEDKGKTVNVKLSEPEGAITRVKLLNREQLNWDTSVPEEIEKYSSDKVFYFFTDKDPSNKEFLYIDLNLDSVFINKNLVEVSDCLDSIVLCGSNLGPSMVKYKNTMLWSEKYEFKTNDGDCALFYEMYFNPYRDSKLFGGSFFLFQIFFLIIALVLEFTVPIVYEKNKLYEQSRSAFTAAAAHELKTPIAVIANSAECIMENVSPEKNEKYVKSIYDESLRMGRLVNSLMQYNRLSSGKSVKIRRCNLAEITITEVEKYRSVAEEKNIDIQTDICKKAKVKADSELIALVIDNYLSNAVKHTESGDTINVSLHYRDIYDSFRLSVFNEGEQISAEHMDKIWNVLYRADEVRNSDDNSSGMGLAISKQILEIHKCTYGAINKSNGVEFYFDIKSKVI